MPRGFFDGDDKQYPLFDLVMDCIRHRLTLRWIDRVPEVLNIFIEPILESRFCELMTENVQLLSIREEIIRDLFRMCAKNEFVWNKYCSRWELHFTE